MRRLFLTLLGLMMVAAGQGSGDERLTVHAAPGPLASGAVVSEWPRFLGPRDDATSPETHLLKAFPEEGPRLLWELEKGESYTAPAIVGDRLVYFHNLDDVNQIECRDPETGARLWAFTYPNRYRDRYGYGKGPRASPVVANGKVYTLAATSQLHCLDLESGALVWQRDLAADYDPGPFFFGHGPSPLVDAGRVVVPLGGGSGVAVAAFDAETGETVWETRHAWRASYASPVVGEFHGTRRLLVYAGGDTDPPAGGLLVLDPETGALRDAFPWRAPKYESVNASTPRVVRDNRVLISETYVIGGTLLGLDPSGKVSPVWQAREYKLHWSMPLVLGNAIYAFTGRNEPDAGLDCWDLETGERRWREEFRWTIPIGGREFGWSFFRGSLLHADDTVYALGEMGTLAILRLSPEGVEITSQAELFHATQSWTLPALSRGLLYVVQNQRDLVTGSGPRLRCYDLRRGAAP